MTGEEARQKEIIKQCNLHKLHIERSEKRLTQLITKFFEDSPIGKCFITYLSDGFVTYNKIIQKKNNNDNEYSAISISNNFENYSDIVEIIDVTIEGLSKYNIAYPISNKVFDKETDIILQKIKKLKNGTQSGI